MNTILLFATGIGLGSAGAILMKKGAVLLPEFSVSSQYALAYATNLYIVTSFVLYFIPALIWTYLLTKYPVSVVQPILSLTYVLTPILAMIFLSESVPVLRWIGIATIILGVYLVSQS